ncbi:response regulator transcription factor [Patescibacteria group bacterium]
MDDKIKILLAEDDQDLQEMYETKFTMEGFEVIKAENGVEALNKVDLEKPHIILLDIVMPEMDGFQALRDLRANPKTKEIPVLLLTNLGQEGDIKKGIELGAADYLIKANFTPNEVVAKVKKILGSEK